MTDVNYYEIGSKGQAVVCKISPSLEPEACSLQPNMHEKRTSTGFALITKNRNRNRIIITVTVQTQNAHSLPRRIPGLLCAGIVLATGSSPAAYIPSHLCRLHSRRRGNIHMMSRRALRCLLPEIFAKTSETQVCALGTQSCAGHQHRRFFSTAASRSMIFARDGAMQRSHGRFMYMPKTMMSMEATSEVPPDDSHLLDAYSRAITSVVVSADENKTPGILYANFLQDMSHGNNYTYRKDTQIQHFFPLQECNMC
jgi:hypothetical protein